MPEQEFRPPRPPAPDGYSGRNDDDPPPWAGLPPVRAKGPSRSHRRPETPIQNPAYPAGDDPYPGAARYEDPAGYGTAAQDRAAPPWTEPEAQPQEAQPQEAEPTPARSDGGSRSGDRLLRAAARRRRRWYLLGGGVVVIAAAVVAVVLLTTGGSGPAAVTPDGLITTFQPGELRQVPDACKVVPAATVTQYLPGQTHQSAPLAVNGTAESACNWTIDQAPAYRLMELNIQAYAPNGLASGNGSATQAAMDAFATTRQDLVSPPQHSAGAKGTVSTVPGLGNEAFSAQQVFKVGGATTDVATVVVRYHNVIVTATLNGLDHSNKGNYGPVSPAQLSAAALAFAKAAEAALTT